MTDRPTLTASLEDYVESIYHIAAKQGAARVTDIAADLDVAKSSVTGALRTLSSKGLVNYDPYSVVTLTSQGSEVAQRVVRRHSILARFLEEVLGLARETAEANACRLEHSLEPRVTERLIRFVAFVESCPRAGEEFRKGFERFFSGAAGELRCADCLGKALESAEALSTCPCRGSTAHAENATDD